MAHEPTDSSARRGRPTPRRRTADALDEVAGRVGVTPRAVLGALLVVLVVLAVLGVRAVRATARSVPEPIPAVGPLVAATGAATASPTPSGVTSQAPTATGSSRVAVHVVGQVRRPGVVTLPTGARVQQALAAAGGALGTADLAKVNLARPLVDGEQVVVPRPGEAAAPAGGPLRSGPGVPGGAGTVGIPIDLNTAGLVELDSLPGVGPVLAQRIVDWRAQNGRFTSVEELGEVSGIGDAVLGALRALVRV